MYANGSSLWHTPQTSDAWVPTTVSENTLRRGEPNGPLRSTSGSLAKQAANPEYWPTPQAQDTHRTPEAYMAMRERIGRQSVSSLAVAVQMWPTPVARRGGSGLDGGSNSRKAAASRGLPISGELNPEWVEWLMGYPIGWTAFEDSGTP
jgi:hypothetical protein